MPPFQYSDASNPFALSIGEMLMRSAEPQARAMSESAAARAQSVRESGQAWGNFAKQAGQLPAQLIESARQREKSDLELTAARDERDQRQGLKALGGLMAKHVTVDADGHSVYDVNGFMTEARQNALTAPLAVDAADRMTKGNDMVTQFRQGQFATKQAAIQNLYAKVAASGGHPVDLEIMSKPLIDAKIISVGDIGPMADRLMKVTDPRVAVTLLNAAAGVKTEYRSVGAGDSLVAMTPGAAPETVLTNAKPVEGPKPGDYEWVRRGNQVLQIVKGTSKPGDAPYQPPSQAQPDYEWVTRNGQPVQIRKGTAQAGDVPYRAETEKPPTSGQFTAATFATRIRQSGDVLKKLEGTVANRGVMAAAYAATAPSRYQSAEQQQFDQASRNFINAVLRRESGAAISSGEFESAYQQYLPKAGDSTKVLAQKAENRRTVFDGLRREGGAAYEEPGVTVLAPDGKYYPFPTQAAADAFKREAGIP